MGKSTFKIRLSTGKRHALTLAFTLLIQSIGTFNTLAANDILLSWDPVINQNISNYKLYYKVHPFSLPFNGTGAIQGNSPVISQNTEINLNGLQEDTIYFFTTTSVSDSGLESPYSEILEVASTNTISNVLSLADSDIATALEKLPQGNNLKLLAVAGEYPENVIIDRCGDTIYFAGGYNSSYSAVSGYSIIRGSLILVCGDLIANNLIIY